MDYTIRYGLEFNPFLKNSKEIFVSTDESKEVLFRLDYLAKTKGFGLLTGSPGRGKATAIRKWVQTLNNSQYKVVYTCFSTFSPNDFYRNLATELGCSGSLALSSFLNGFFIRIPPCRYPGFQRTSGQKSPGESAGSPHH